MEEKEKTKYEDKKDSNSSSNVNLLKNKMFKKFMQSRWYPGIFQWPVLIVFAFIVYELLVGPSVAHDNFGTAGTWVLWWPLLPIMLFLLGRFWCAICPFGLINDLVQKFVGNNRPVPKFLRKYGIWIIDAMFIMITWSDHVWGVVESPRGSAVVLLIITAGVIFSGAFFERRTWCRYLCFLGGVSSNYTRVGMMELRATPEKCAKCKVLACYKGSEKADGCPMFEFPRAMETNAECNFCGNCVKNCPNDSIKMYPRVPTKELWSIRKPKLPESFLAVVIMGIVFVQNITMLAIWKDILSWLERTTGTTSYYVTFTVTFIIAMLIPIILLSVTGLIAKKFNGDSVRQNFARFGYAIIPLDLAAHIAHNLFHLLAEGKSVIFTFVELFGVNMHGSTALLDNETIQALQYILIVIGALGSIYTVYKISKHTYGNKNSIKTTVVYTILLVFLAVVNLILFALPMEMRM
ncbi:4Fe-4S binding domain-containing protein [Clostridium pasteurianum DSM 525 = ATCC 6013]|uniref:4Fe-4S binding domain-containing protein n=1 Tax=Clostridium pasteurianum DSM 525 = ATCC 6013 TaxID=1262449 RepID=A0A0H3JAJ9_CLOPA|nr:4Fe-4S binding protein [Clostridium pasteurianum]AJA48625.1 4Fe-4S binding domain-containing protein [Clostridium pasteurianum DSM 525 = ATCC 6013]AJA52613.1 4Fe-4S binding domain-containing protein [Clostridium pasteurianum DSM 525 = ATCC 6013]AOZ75855.1 ferredoxin [Clostridium pasteurianum DSM 525 = ATCC 6013]AOZ79651.1 ferredoxin [Clostridium pasteurianum]ELP57897.1 iron-sulfur cluster-binding protein [Clostridium pasteurianum DSM 525 = ATCC 6013]